MKNSTIQSLLSVVLLALAVCAPAQSFLDVADASLDALREGREQNAAPANVRAIFAKAKAAADDDDKLNLCGFYVGMSAADAQTLAGYYSLKYGEWSTAGDPVYKITLSLKGVRRVTKGVNTFDELAQAVANRVGSLKQDWKTKVYSLETIDGITVSLSESNGFGMVDEIRALTPLIPDMVPIPGKDYRMGKYEVTQALWEAVMGNNPSNHKGANLPVENVSWNDCQEFLRKLNSKVKAAGLVFRLPTEGEWKYACRAGGEGSYCRLAGGTEITDKWDLKTVAWFEDNSGDKTHPVGEKEPNAFGLYDMHGNVWERTQENYECGGGYYNSASLCTYYSSSHPTLDPDGDLGFRLCASIRPE